LAKRSTRGSAPCTEGEVCQQREWLPGTNEPSGILVNEVKITQQL
jgi:hypothetical protein